MFGLSEIGILLLVVILALSAKKLPGLARSAGKAARVLKSEKRAMKSDGESPHDGPPPRVIRVEPEKRTDVILGRQQDGTDPAQPAS